MNCDHDAVNADQNVDALASNHAHRLVDRASIRAPGTVRRDIPAIRVPVGRYAVATQVATRAHWRHVCSRLYLEIHGHRSALKTVMATVRSFG